MVGNYKDTLFWFHSCDRFSPIFSLTNNKQVFILDILNLGGGLNGVDLAH